MTSLSLTFTPIKKQIKKNKKIKTSAPNNLFLSDMSGTASAQLQAFQSPCRLTALAWSHGQGVGAAA